MSGTAFLEEIVSWDDQKRTEKMDEALPRLIICFEKCQSVDEAFGILQILCQSFVPKLQEDQLEERVFSKVAQQVCGLLDQVLLELQEAVAYNTTVSDRLVVLLQGVVQVLQCVDDCIKHAADTRDVQMLHVRSLVSCSFHVLNRSYTHCQDSSSLYGHHLPALSESLSLVFRMAHTLQMSLLKLVDKLATPNRKGCDTDITDITGICQSLFSLCQVVACLDLKLTISVWKALSKLAGGKAGDLHDQIDVNRMVGYLCDEINTGVHHLLQSAPPAVPLDQDVETLSQGDDKVFCKSLRVLSFQAKVLVALVRDFHQYLTTAVSWVLQLSLHFNSLLPPCLSAARLQQKHEDDIRQQLTSICPLIVSHLVSNPIFISSLLSDNNLESQMRDDYGCLMLRMMVVDIVAQSPVGILERWLQPQQTHDKPVPGLLTSVCVSIRHCHVELCLPVYVLVSQNAGKPPRLVSLYQHVVERLCSLIASCPASLWPTVEEWLFATAMDVNPVIFLAASDCWCFLARLIPSELFWQYVQHLVSVVEQAVRCSPTHCCLSSLPLTNLLGRLVKFLTPKHQVALVRLLSGDRGVAVWSQVGLGGLGEEALKELTPALVPACLQSLHAFSTTASPTLLQTAALIPSLSCLHSVLMSCPLYLAPQQAVQLLTDVCSMWRTVPLDHNFRAPGGGDYGLTCRYMTALVSLTSAVASQLDVDILLKVLTVSHKLILVTSDEAAVSILHFLQALGPLRVPPVSQQREILQKLCQVFAAGLTSPSACVQLAALEAFTSFAEQTVHETVVSGCLALNAQLQDRVAAYLQKVVYPPGSQFDAVSYLREQQQYLSGQVLPELNTASDQLDDGQPPSKRQRLDLPPSGQEDYEQLLRELSALADRADTLKDSGGLSSLVMTQAKPVLQRLFQSLNQV